jgi:hypothetical protein
MPAGQSSTPLNRLPIYPEDNAILGTLYVTDIVVSGIGGASVSSSVSSLNSSVSSATTRISVLASAVAS